MSQQEVDLIVVTDHKFAEEICKALKHAGIHHVEFWPEHLLEPRNAFEGAPLPGMVGLFQRTDKAHLKGDPGPYHIRVRQEDLAQAQLVLSSGRLTAG